MKHLRYLWYVLRHKWYVMRMCHVLRIPIQGIIHDWSKFLPSEWFAYVEFFYGQVKGPAEKIAFDQAWNKHQKRNPHHWQYWILVMDSGEKVCMPIPVRYILEMVADWYGAGKAIGGGTPANEWYFKNRDRIQMHEYSRLFLEEVLTWPKVRNLFG